MRWWSVGIDSWCSDETPRSIKMGKANHMTFSHLEQFDTFRASNGAEEKMLIMKSDDAVVRRIIWCYIRGYKLIAAANSGNKLQTNAPTTPSPSLYLFYILLVW